MARASWNIAALHQSKPLRIPWKDAEIRVEFTLQDAWWGVYWQYDWETDAFGPDAYVPAEHVIRVWICLIPFIPIYIRLVMERKYG